MFPSFFVVVALSRSHSFFLFPHTDSFTPPLPFRLLALVGLMNALCLLLNQQNQIDQVQVWSMSLFRFRFVNSIYYFFFSSFVCFAMSTSSILQLVYLCALSFHHHLIMFFAAAPAFDSFILIFVNLFVYWLLSPLLSWSSKTLLYQLIHMLFVF